MGLAVSGKDAVVPPQKVLRLAAKLKADGRRVLLINREEAGHSTQSADAKTNLEFVLHETPGNDHQQEMNSQYPVTGCHWMKSEGQRPTIWLQLSANLQ